MFVALKVNHQTMENLRFSNICCDPILLEEKYQDSLKKARNAWVDLYSILTNDDIFSGYLKERLLEILV